jgi:hypothetical protein
MIKVKKITERIMPIDTRIGEDRSFRYLKYRTEDYTIIPYGDNLAFFPNDELDTNGVYTVKYKDIQVPRGVIIAALERGGIPEEEFQMIFSKTTSWHK